MKLHRLTVMTVFQKKGTKGEGTKEEGTVTTVTTERKSARLGIFARNHKAKHADADAQPGESKEQAPAAVNDEDRNEEPDTALISVKSNRSFFSNRSKEGTKNQKKVVYDSFGNADLLMTWTNYGIPAVESPDDVVVRIEVSTVSMHDCLMRRGICFSVTDPVCLPATPGMDLVGTIVTVGEQVQDFKVGDRVAALVRTGGNARYCVVPQQSLVIVPRYLDASEAVAMVSVYMAAYQSLMISAAVIEGSTVLVTGAGMGPVEQALIQLSLRAGATQVYCTAPDRHHRYVRSVLGATPLPTNQWLPIVEEKMDVVFDSLCQDGFESSFKALKNTGTLVCVGMSSLLQNEPMGAFGAPLSAFWARTKAQYFMSRTHFYDVWESFKSDPKKFKADLATILDLLNKREIKPHIAKRIALADVQGAQTILEVGPQPRGIIVCLPWRRRKVNIRPGREQPEA